MEITVSLPQQEPIDFNQTCYAYLVIGVSGIRILQVEKSISEVKAQALVRADLAKSTYKKKMYRYMNQANLDSIVPDKFHRGIGFQIAECDMKLYLYFHNPGKKTVRFIFENSVPPLKIKYAR